MGRLFWKLFLVFFLAQLTTTLGVGLTMGLRGPGPGWHSPPFPPPSWPHPPANGSGFPPGPPPPPPGVPMEPLVLGLIASLLFSALLARYLSLPIRKLRAAVNAAAEGDLRVQPGAEMGLRRDELTDLGHDFDRMAQRLRLQMENQRRLLHDVSHELRSPLARQQAALDLCQQQPDKLPHWLTRIEQEVQRMDSLVGELLTLARLEEGGIDSITERLELGALLQEIIDDACFELGDGQKSILFSQTEAHWLLGQRELLRRALENVIRNALRFTAAGTEVTITLQPESNDRVRVRICDQGPGVLPSELEAIFIPFHRGHLQPGEAGHGLGLSIARRIVLSHGGGIRAKNQVSGGLCIEIHLPLAG